MSAVDERDPEAAPGASSRSRWRVSAHETNVLEAVFASSPRPNKNTLHQLATMLGVKPRQVQVWFQNRRQRWRKDFLELERARSMQLAELSGKVLDFDLLGPAPPPPADDAAGAPAEQPAPSLPVGWENLLLAPGESPPEAQPFAPRVKAEAAESEPLRLAARPPAAGAGARGGLKPEQPVRLADILLCDLLSLAPAKGAGFAPDSPAPLTLPPSELSPSPSLDGSPRFKSSSTFGEHSSEPSDDADDTIWLGMEWLVDDSEELAGES